MAFKYILGIKYNTNTNILILDYIKLRRDIFQKAITVRNVYFMRHESSWKCRKWRWSRYRPRRDTEVLWGVRGGKGGCLPPPQEWWGRGVIISCESSTLTCRVVLCSVCTFMTQQTRNALLGTIHRYTESIPFYPTLFSYTIITEKYMSHQYWNR